MFSMTWMTGSWAFPAKATHVSMSAKNTCAFPDQSLGLITVRRNTQVKTTHVRDKRVEFIAPTAKIGIVPIAGWTRMLRQNPTTGIYLLLHELFIEGFLSFEDKLSSEYIVK